MNDDGGSRGGSRTQPSSGGGKYYPSVDELVEANGTRLDELIGKLPKDWIICLLKDTVTHLREAKSFKSDMKNLEEKVSFISNAIETNINRNDDVLKKVEELQSMKTKIDSFIQKPNFLQETIADQNYQAQLKFIGVAENDKKSFTERQLTDKESLEKIFADLNITPNIIECRRLGKFHQGKKRPILVTFGSVWDARICKNKAIENKYYAEKKVLIVSELSPKDKLIEKSLLKKRYDMIQEGYDKRSFKIRGLKLFLDGEEISVK